MRNNDVKAPSKTDKQTKAIGQVWSEFSHSLGQIKNRITTLKRSQEEKERDVKLSAIQQAIDKH
jgi:hypothetical protein